MTTGNVQLSLDGAVARVTISNPRRYNAMSLAMWKQLCDIIAAVNDMPDIGVVLLRGDGEKAFVSGADISEFETQRGDAESVVAHDLIVERAESALVECAKPVIACIHGICMGGGMGIALSCDLRYAARNAKFRMPAARLGVGYAFNTGVRLLRSPHGAEPVCTRESRTRGPSVFEGNDAGFLLSRK